MIKYLSVITGKYLVAKYQQFYVIAYKPNDDVYINCTAFYNDYNILPLEKMDYSCYKHVTNKGVLNGIYVDAKSFTHIYNVTILCNKFMVTKINNNKLVIKYYTFRTPDEEEKIVNKLFPIELHEKVYEKYLSINNNIIPQQPSCKVSETSNNTLYDVIDDVIDDVVNDVSETINISATPPNLSLNDFSFLPSESVDISDIIPDTSFSDVSINDILMVDADNINSTNMNSTNTDTNSTNTNMKLTFAEEVNSLITKLTDGEIPNEEISTFTVDRILDEITKHKIGKEEFDNIVNNFRIAISTISNLYFGSVRKMLTDIEKSRHISSEINDKVHSSNYIQIQDFNEFINSVLLNNGDPITECINIASHNNNVDQSKKLINNYIDILAKTKMSQLNSINTQIYNKLIKLCNDLELIENAYVARNHNA